MSQGIPLIDEDRWPWLRQIRASIEDHLGLGASAVYACSALKESYRRILTGEDTHVIIVYLKGTPSQIQARMQRRQHHFMPPKLLLSQFDTLEEPEHAWVINIDQSPEDIVEEILTNLQGD